MKYFLALTAALVAGASAFTAPVSYTTSPSSSALDMSVFDDMVGASDYRGKKFEFDPVSKKFDQFFPLF